MPDIPVIAYHVLAEEKTLILQHVRPVEVTQSFVAGIVDTNDVALLRKRGILVDFLQTASASEHIRKNVLPVKGTGRFVQYTSDMSGIGPVVKQDLFLIQVIGPLLPSWKKRLEEAHVTIIENLQQDLYKVKSTRELEFFSSFDFILSSRPFESTDTEVVIRKSAFPEGMFEVPSQKIALYDVKTEPSRTTIPVSRQ